jgi:DNA-directed RNA polymerase specialized sigma24 family protein
VQEQLLELLESWIEHKLEPSVQTRKALSWVFTHVRQYDHNELVQSILLEAAERWRDNHEVLHDDDFRRAIWKVAKSFSRAKRFLPLQGDIPCPDVSTQEVDAEDQIDLLSKQLKKTLTDFDALVLDRLLEGIAPFEITRELGVSQATYYRSAFRIKQLLRGKLNLGDG